MKVFTLKQKKRSTLTTLLIVVAALVSNVFAQGVVVSQWNSYTASNPPADGRFLAKEGTVLNKGVAVLSRDAAGTGYAVNTDLVAASQGWDAANETEKYWLVEFNTTGYENLTVTSKQRGSNTGPVDFKIQWKVASGEWTDVPEGVIKVSSSNYTLGTKTDLPLPSEMTNKSQVALRWLCTSTTSIGNGIVAGGGVNRLDVTVSGTLMAGVSNPDIEVSTSNLFFAKPETSLKVTVSATDLTSNITIDSDNTSFTISPASLPNDAANAEVTVTFSGTETTSGIITLTSEDAVEKITVTGFVSEFGNDGSKERPFTINEAIAVNGKTATESFWVEGYIIGSVNTSTGEVISNYAASNLALGADAEGTSHMSVQLPPGDVRTALNLVDNVGNLGKKVKIFGTLETYCSIPGIKNSSDYEFIDDSSNDNPLLDNVLVYSDNKQLYISNLQDHSSIYIYDLTGRLVFNKQSGISNEVIPVAQQGVYVVRIVSDMATKAQKVIVK